MRAVDTSVLAYAANRFAPEHARALEVVESLANGDRPWALPWSVAHEFLRLVTHPHAVARVAGPAEAWEFIESLLASPSVRALGPGESHAQALAEVLALMPPGSAMAAGFETAVLLREHGVRELLSADHGMTRFPFLEVTDPVHGEEWEPAQGPTRRYRVLHPRSRG